MVVSRIIGLLLAALLSCSIQILSSTDASATPTTFDCSNLDANTKVEDIFKNECKDIASPNGDFDLVVTDSNKDAFKEWICDKLKISRVNMLIENTQLDELVFPKNVFFIDNTKFIVRNNAELIKVHFANSWFTAKQITISDNPKLESITGIRHNIEMKIAQTQSKTTIENNSQLKTLWLKQIILSKASISNNPELKDLQLSGGIHHSDVAIRNNKKLRKIDTTVQMQVHMNNSTLTIEGSEALMELDFTSVRQFISSNLQICDNKALESVKFNHEDHRWFQFKKMEFSRNRQLKTVTLPISIYDIERAFINELILSENGKLETFAPFDSLNSSSTNTTIKFCPSLKNIDEIMRISNLEFSNFEKYDDCKFPTPLTNFTELKSCNSVDGELQLTDNAIGSTANCAIAEIRGDLKLGNNEAAKLGCLLTAKILGEVYSTICDFDYSIFPNAGTTAKPIPCSMTTTTTTTDKPSHPSPTENEQITGESSEEVLSSPSSSDQQVDDNSSSNPGLIVGIAVVIILVMLLISAVFILIKQKKTKAAVEKLRKELSDSDIKNTSSIDKLSSKVQSEPEDKTKKIKSVVEGGKKNKKENNVKKKSGAERKKSEIVGGKKK